MAHAAAHLLKQMHAVSRPLYGPLALSLPLVVLNRIASLVMPASTRFLVDDIILNRRDDLLWIFLAITGAGAVAQAVSALGLARCMGRARARLVARTRATLQAHVLSLPLGFHESEKTGALASTVMNDTEALPRLLTGGIVDASSAAIGAAVAFVLLLRLDAVLAWSGLALVDRARGPLATGAAEGDDALSRSSADEAGRDGPPARNARRHPPGEGVWRRAARERDLR